MAKLAETDPGTLLLLANQNNPHIATAARAVLLKRDWQNEQDTPQATELLAVYGERPQPYRIAIVQFLSNSVDPTDRATAARLIAEDPDPAVGLWAVAELRTDTQTLTVLKKHALAKHASRLPALSAALGYAVAIDDPTAAASHFRNALATMPADLVTHPLTLELRRTLVDLSGNDDTALADAALRMKEDPWARAEHMMLAARLNRASNAPDVGSPEEQLAAFALGEDKPSRELLDQLVTLPVMSAVDFLVRHGKADRAAVLGNAIMEADDAAGGKFMAVLGPTAEAAGLHDLAAEACYKAMGRFSGEGMYGYEAHYYANRMRAKLNEGDPQAAGRYMDDLLRLSNVGTDEIITAMQTLTALDRETEADDLYNREKKQLDARRLEAEKAGEGRNIVTAKNNLAWLMVQSGRELDRAQTLAEDAAAAAPQEGFILDTLAAVVYAQGDAERAARLERQALLGKPGDPQLMQQLAKFQQGAAATDQ